MPVVPKKKLPRLEFYEQHETVWTDEAANIGLAAGDPAALAAKNAAARAAYENHLAAQQNARAATQGWYEALADLSTFGAGLIDKIRAKAKTGGGDATYTLAQISAPPTPSPVAAPGTPDKFKVEVDQSGALILSWGCPNPAGATGTTYLVSRQVSGAGEFVVLGATGKKTFTDTALPAGTTAVTYRIRAQRSTAQGLPAEFTVKFGTGSAGQVTATVQGPPSSPKLAA
jgi:hypothetical protein